MTREWSRTAAESEDDYTNPEVLEWLDKKAGMWRKSNGKFLRAATVGEMPYQRKDHD